MDLLNPEPKVWCFLQPYVERCIFRLIYLGSVYELFVCGLVYLTGCSWWGVWGGFGKGGCINCDVPPDLRCLEPKIFIKTSASHLSTSARSPAPDYSFLFIGLPAGTWKPLCLFEVWCFGKLTISIPRVYWVSSLQSWVFNTNKKGNNYKQRSSQFLFILSAF